MLNLSKNLIEFIKEIFEELKKNGINYCVLRNYEGFWEQTGFDIDVLIDRGHLTKAFNLLKAETRKKNYVFSVLEKKTSIKIFISDLQISNKSRCWIYLDLQSSVNCFNNKYMFEYNDVSTDSYYIDETVINVLSKKWSFIFLLHKNLKKKSNGSDYDNLKNIYQKNKSENFKLLCKLFDEEISDNINSTLCGKDNHDEFETLRNKLFGLQIFRLFRNIKQNINQYLIKKMFIPFFIFKRSNAPVVIISGADGVGKTTLIDILSEILLSLPLDSGSVHHMYWKKKKKLNKIKSGEVKSLKNYIKNLLRIIIPSPITSIINLCLGEYYYIQGVTKIFFNSYINSSLIILDRYVIDRYAKIKSIGKNNRSTMITKGIIPFMKKPLLQIYLLDDPQNIVQRKQELNERQILLYQDILLNENNGEIVWVNNRMPNEVAVDIARKIFDCLNGRKLFSLIGSWEDKQKVSN